MKCCKSDHNLNTYHMMHQPSMVWNNANGNINHQGKHNGHVLNGVAPRPWSNGYSLRPDDKQSTLSRYWTVERPRNGHISNYQAIKRNCRERGILFEDPSFPPNNRSLCLQKKPPLQPIVWARPHELCQRPKFIADNCADSIEGSRFDIEPGELGDTWLLAAVSSLTLTPRFLDRVVPPDQSFDPGTYCGMFRFCFWHFGEWKDVLIDDRLPTFRGRLVYLHSTNPTEFWAALLEKAYAKLYGCYENLHFGFTTRALQDLTGGIVQSFGLSNQEKYLTFQVLNSAVPRSTLLIASIYPEKEGKRQLRLRNGLVTQHSYSVTGLARVRGPMGDTPLVRLRNPWGKGEWTGPWSERSWEWDGLNDRDKELLSVRVQNDGEFWMSFEDFAKHFTHLDLVHVGPDDWMNEPALQSKQPWRAVLARRRWRSGYNAGGSPLYIETTAVNPQFHIQIPRSSGNKCHVVVSVTQHYETHYLDNKKKKPLHAIGFAVYEVPPSTTRLTQHFVLEHKPLDVTNHSIGREVVTFFTLPPGDYIVVPQTSVPNCDGKFLLRIFTDEQSNIWEVNEDNVVFRNVSTEFLEETVILPDGKPLIAKLLLKYPPEVDAVQLQKILKSHWKAYLSEKPSLELCKSLIMLRDYNISGRINLMDIPVLMHMLQCWRMAFQKLDKSHGNKTSSYNLRSLLWEAGTTVSNKVLECLVLRFTKNRILTSECFVMAMVRLHLAHESMPDYENFEDDHGDRSSRLTNDDFRRLLMTPRATVPVATPLNATLGGNRDRDGPKSSISMAPSLSEVEDKAERRRKKKSFYAKLKKQEEDKMAELAEKYRDRAKERREGANPDYQAEDPLTGASGYRAVAPDLKSGLDAAERRRQMIQESKFLGGDMEHTHLVKGLDYALLQKVRSEIQLRENEGEEEMEKLANNAALKKEKKKSKDENDEMQFKTVLARNIYRFAIGLKTVERNELFAPGRMAYCIDLDDELADSDIPTTLIRSKADVPQLEQSATLTTNDIVINKLAQILSYLRQGSRHGKKGKKKDKGRDKGKLLDESIYGDIGDYIPNNVKDKNKANEKKKGNYFPKAEEDTRKESWDSVRAKTDTISLNKKEKSRDGLDDRMPSKSAAQLLTKLAAEPEGYAECYPGLDEMQDAIEDSDDEVDYTKMDLGNKKGPIGRWDFDTQEEYSQYMNNKEALPKAAFQYGVKMADGRRTRTKTKEKNEKQQLDREWNKIQNIIQKRKISSNKDEVPEFKIPRY